MATIAPMKPSGRRADARNGHEQRVLAEPRPRVGESHAAAEDAAPYGVPRPARTHQLSFIDLFAGCGGLSLGLEQAGFHPLLFSEINHSAAETYLANRIGTAVVPIGDIYTLTDTNLRLLMTCWSYRGIADVDLVCGGPPCQGYSGIGHRRTFRLSKDEIPSNFLFREMARVIRCVRPKAFLFENVRGLLHARWTPRGTNGEIFRAVLDEFKAISGYTVRWDLLHAKDYGVPQNRPRVILVGFRNELGGRWTQQMLLDHPYELPTAVRCGFLPPPSGSPPDLEDLLSDLEDPDYLGKPATVSYPRPPLHPIQVALRTKRDGGVLAKGDPLSEQEYSDHAPYIRDKFRHMIAHGGEIPEQYRTKKFAQRVFPRRWGPGGPNLTATSLPEDYVHYSQPRGPTVREWARMQTFPDWYVFRGPRTTGGRRRAGDPDKGHWDRDVPRYTQIGNAVPVLLARVIGEHLAGIINGPRVPRP